MKYFSYLKCVTLTGADESVDPRDLCRISERYPFVEWGILVSFERAGLRPRYPSVRWRECAHQVFMRHPNVRASAHLCGAAARAFPRIDLFGTYQRIQLNGLTFPVPEAVREDSRRLIFQARGVSDIDSAHVESKPFDILYDESGGRGVAQTRWPYAPQVPLMGFAGGIGADNVQAVVRELASRQRLFWIDMESSLRGDDDSSFDLERAELVLDRVRALSDVL